MTAVYRRHNTSSSHGLGPRYRVYEETNYIHPLSNEATPRQLPPSCSLRRTSASSMNAEFTFPAPSQPQRHGFRRRETSHQQQHHPPVYLRQSDSRHHSKTSLSPRDLYKSHAAFVMTSSITGPPSGDLGSDESPFSNSQFDYSSATSPSGDTSTSHSHSHSHSGNSNKGHSNNDSNRDAATEHHRPAATGRKQSHGQLSRPRWLSQMKDWLSVAEPSAQAMKQQKRSAYKKHGIDPKDPLAAAKMHLPFGQIPAGATTSTTGPSPEKVLRSKAQQGPR